MDFGQVVYVTRLAYQGAGWGWDSAVMKSYRYVYSSDDVTWSIVGDEEDVSGFRVNMKPV